MVNYKKLGKLLLWRCRQKKQLEGQLPQATAAPNEEVEDAPLVLLPCVSCKRTFRPEALAKHSKVCEKTLMKKRKAFDSSKQRLQGTEVESFATLPAAAKTPARKSRAKEKLDLEKALQAVKRPPPDPNPQVRPSDHDECPHCGRSFGPKAFERHTQFCKEQQLKLKSTPTANPEAKERLKVRTSYKGPLTNKVLNRDRYHPKRDPSPMSSELRDDGSRSRGLTRNASLRSSFRSRASDTTPPPPLRRTMTQISSTRSRRSREKEEVIASPQGNDGQRQGMPRLYTREQPDRKVKSPRWNSSVSLSNKSLLYKDMDRNSLPSRSYTYSEISDKKLHKPKKRNQDFKAVNITDLSVSSLESNEIIYKKAERSAESPSYLKSSSYPEELLLLPGQEKYLLGSEPPRKCSTKSSKGNRKPKSDRQKNKNAVELCGVQMKCSEPLECSKEGIYECNDPRTDNLQNFGVVGSYTSTVHPRGPFQGEQSLFSSSFHSSLGSNLPSDVSNPNLPGKSSEIAKPMYQLHEKAQNPLDDATSFSFYQNIDVPNSILAPLDLTNNCSMRTRTTQKREKEYTNFSKNNDLYRSAENMADTAIECDNFINGNKNSPVDKKASNIENLNFSICNQAACEALKSGVDFMQIAHSKEGLLDESFTLKSEHFSTQLDALNLSDSNENFIFNEMNHIGQKYLRDRPKSCSMLLAINEEGANETVQHLHGINKTASVENNRMVESDLSPISDLPDAQKLLVPKKLWNDATECSTENNSHPQTPNLSLFNSAQNKSLNSVECPEDCLDSVNGRFKPIIDSDSVKLDISTEHLIKVAESEVESPHTADVVSSRLVPLKVNTECNLKENKNDMRNLLEELVMSDDFVYKNQKDNAFACNIETPLSVKDTFAYEVNSFKKSNNDCQEVFSSRHNSPQHLSGKPEIAISQDIYPAGSNVASVIVNNSAVKKGFNIKNICNDYESQKLENPSGLGVFQINDDGHLYPLTNTKSQNDGDSLEFANSFEVNISDNPSSSVENPSIKDDHDYQNEVRVSNRCIQDFQILKTEDQEFNQGSLLIPSCKIEPICSKVHPCSKHYGSDSFCGVSCNLRGSYEQVDFHDTKTVELTYPVLEFVTVTGGVSSLLRTPGIVSYDCGTKSEELEIYAKQTNILNSRVEDYLGKDIVADTNNVIEKTNLENPSVDNANVSHFTQDSNSSEIRRRPSTHPLCSGQQSGNQEETRLSETQKKKYYSLDSKSFEIVFSPECSNFLRDTFENCNLRGLPQEYTNNSFSSVGMDCLEKSTSTSGFTYENDANSISLYFVDRDDSQETTKLNPNFIEKNAESKVDLLKSKSVEEMESTIDRNILDSNLRGCIAPDLWHQDENMKHSPNVAHKPFQRWQFNEDDIGVLPASPLLEEISKMYPSPEELDSFSEDSLDQDRTESLSRTEDESTYSDSLVDITPQKSPILFWDNKKLCNEESDYVNCSDNINRKYYLEGINVSHQNSKLGSRDQSKIFSEAGLKFNCKTNNEKCHYNEPIFVDEEFKNVLPPFTIYKKISKETEKISMSSDFERDQSAQIFYENTRIVKNVCNIGSSGCTSDSERSIPISSCDENTLCFKHCSKTVEYYQNGNDCHTIKTSVYELPKLGDYYSKHSSKYSQNSTESSQLISQDFGKFPYASHSEGCSDVLKLPPIQMSRPILNSIPASEKKLNYTSLQDHLPAYDSKVSYEKPVPHSNGNSKLYTGDMKQHFKAFCAPSVKFDQGKNYQEPSRLPYVKLLGNSLMNSAQDLPLIQPRKSRPVLEEQFPNSAQFPHKENSVNLPTILRTSSIFCDLSSLKSRDAEKYNPYLSAERQMMELFGGDEEAKTKSPIILPEIRSSPLQSSPTSAFVKYSSPGSTINANSPNNENNNSSECDKTDNLKKLDDYVRVDNLERVDNLGRPNNFSLSSLSLCSVVSLESVDCNRNAKSAGRLEEIQRSFSALEGKSRTRNKVNMREMLYGARSPEEQAPQSEGSNSDPGNLEACEAELLISMLEFEKMLKSSPLPSLESSPTLCSSVKVEDDSREINNETEKHKNLKNISHNSIDSAYSSLTRSAGGGEGDPAQTEPPSFCHECGTRYPVATAKFCCNCGMKRIVL